MSDSGANQDKLVKQINGILKSGKVTQEEMQAFIESLGKKNKPVKEKKHKKSSTDDTKSPTSSSSSLLSLSSKAKASSKASSKASPPLSAKKELKSLSSLVVKGDLTSDHQKTDVESQSQANSSKEKTDKKNKIEQVQPAIKKPRLGEQTATFRIFVSAECQERAEVVVLTVTQGRFNIGSSKNLCRVAAAGRFRRGGK
jgi:hypothetical protein